MVVAEGTGRGRTCVGVGDERVGGGSGGIVGGCVVGDGGEVNRASTECLGRRVFSHPPSQHIVETSGWRNERAKRKTDYKNQKGTSTKMVGV